MAYGTAEMVHARAVAAELGEALAAARPVWDLQTQVVAMEAEPRLDMLLLGAAARLTKMTLARPHAKIQMQTLSAAAAAALGRSTSLRELHCPLNFEAAGAFLEAAAQGNNRTLASLSLPKVPTTNQTFLKPSGGAARRTPRNFGLQETLEQALGRFNETFDVRACEGAQRRPPCRLGAVDGRARVTRPEARPRPRGTRESAAVGTVAAVWFDHVALVEALQDSASLATLKIWAGITDNDDPNPDDVILPSLRVLSFVGLAQVRAGSSSTSRSSSRSSRSGSSSGSLCGHVIVV
eukprot:7224523-Prymnesium_polylepis.1